MLTMLLLLVFALCVAFMFNSGLWSCVIGLFNVIVATMIAINYFEPLADFFDSQYKDLTYTYDFIALWLIFAVAYTAFRVLTDFISKVNVRFKRPVDVAGGLFFSACVGWVMVCFTTMTLHTAPLHPDFLGAFATPQTREFFGFAPDRVWLAFAQQNSQGVLSRSNTFDPKADYIFKYRARRVAGLGKPPK
jgi:hypothetical protein